MKETLRDKVCQLIGKYQAEEAFYWESAFASQTLKCPYAKADAVKAEYCQQFLKDLKKLLEEEDATA